MYPESRDLSGGDERPYGTRKICFEVEKGHEGETDSLISALTEAYQKFYAWDSIVSQAEVDSVENGHSRERPIKQLSSYSAEIPAEDKPRIETIHGTSPVVVEVTGAPGPLQRLQRYFANRHVDWDREGKEPSEDRRLQLETQRIDAVRQQVDLLHALGFPEIQIREALSHYVFAPLDRLERHEGIKFVRGKPQTNTRD
ncbi:MAG TPA: hypothetical protein VHM64_13875 [Candidatus Binatia bacterium]|nr:hypothetical protein [Candidatus Binatia bacterium]